MSAFDAATGDVRWNATENDSFRTGPTVASTASSSSSASRARCTRETRRRATPHGQSTGDFVGPVADDRGATSRSPARTARSPRSVDGRQLVGDFAASDAVAPDDPTPDYQLGLTGAAAAVWWSTRARSCAGSARCRADSPRCRPDGSTRSPSAVLGSGLPDDGGRVQRTKPCSSTRAAPCTSSTRRPAIPSASATTRTARSPPAATAVVDGSQVFMTLGGALRAVDLPSGNAALDRRAAPETSCRTDRSSSATTSCCCTSSDPTTTARVDDEVVAAFDRVTGEVRWTRRHDTGGQRADGRGRPDHRRFASHRARSRDGSIVWQVEPGRDVVGATRPTTPTRDAVVAAVRTIDGNRRHASTSSSVDARNRRGAMAHADSTGAPSSPRRSLCTTGSSSSPSSGLPIVAFDEATGAERWRFAPPPPGTPPRHVDRRERPGVDAVEHRVRSSCSTRRTATCSRSRRACRNDVGSFLRSVGSCSLARSGDVFIAPMAVPVRVRRAGGTGEPSPPAAHAPPSPRPSGSIGALGFGAVRELHLGRAPAAGCSTCAGCAARCRPSSCSGSRCCS